MEENIKIKRNINTESNNSNTIDSSVLTAGIPNSVLCDVMSGSKRATSEMMGHRTNLAPSIQAKMSKAFGMDFSNLAIYSSDYMAQTKAGGMAQGNKVVLSSDINLNTLEGQAILGHELSHIHAQSMGEGLGHSGLYDNAALEQKADAEGMMAARGMNIFGEISSMSESTGMSSFDSLTPIGSGMGATAGAPMQAFLFGNKKTKAQKALANPDDYFTDMQAVEGRNEEEDEELQKNYYYPKLTLDEFLDTIPWKSGEDDENLPEGISYNDFCFNNAIITRNKLDKNKKVNKINNKFQRYSDDHILPDQIKFNKLSSNPKNLKNFHPEPLHISGLDPNRLKNNLNMEMADNYSADETEEMLANIICYDKQEDGIYKSGNIDENRVFNGLYAYRKMLYHQLKRMEREFGTLLTQMHPHDLIKRFGVKKLTSNIQIMQDIIQIYPMGKNTDETREYIRDHFNDIGMDNDVERLYDYYCDAFCILQQYFDEMQQEEQTYTGSKISKNNALGFEKNIKGPKMNPNQLNEYRNRINKQIDKGELLPWLEDID